MSEKRKYTAYVIGTGSLLIQCSEVLLGDGNEILGVVSGDPGIGRWAQGKGLPTLAFDFELGNVLRQRPADYIFSIANLAILQPEVLESARRGVVNFHDGPLPRYAGLYATSWAILEEAESHGVTWHLVEGGVDAGGILKQEIFPISPGETALTLNAKCYEAGIRTFIDLSRELGEGGSQPRKHDLLKRTYYSLSRRPASGCAIAWGWPAEKISALVRALDFGSYSNPLGLPKACSPSGWFGVGECRIAPAASGEPPGTIVALETETVTVATGTRDVTLAKLSALDGSPRTPAQLSLALASRLAILDSQQAAGITSLHEEVARHEAFWVQRLVAVSLPELPYLKALRLSAGASRLGIHLGEDSPSQLATVAGRMEAREPGDAVVAALCAYIGRISGASSYDLGFSEPALRRRVLEADSLFASVVPLHVELSSESAAIECLRSQRLALDGVRRRMTYARDVGARYPQLRGPGKTPGDEAWPFRIELVEQLSGTETPVGEVGGAALTVLVEKRSGRTLWVHNLEALGAEGARELERRFGYFLAALAANLDSPLSAISVLDQAERLEVILKWNATALEYPRDLCVHQLFEAQARRSPELAALVFQGQSLTFRELDERSNRIARHLRKTGVGPDTLVGVFLHRSLDLVPCLLAILKAGGAYLPLDPGYAPERLAFMLSDAKAPVLVTQASLVAQLPPFAGRVVCVDTGPDRDAILHESSDGLSGGSTPESLAYVIYTSGSTGKPKGVMIEHRNVVNFFAGMDERIARGPEDSWLAVTSLSFDISVLELFWTLTRGIRVVLHGERSRGLTPGGVGSISTRPIQFSLFYFASDERQTGRDKYRLLLEGAKFADQNGFTAVWSPERHFHAFGGLYPNPSVASAAIAAITERVKIRAGSVVLPLHHPVRVAEEWALVDNLSNGRVGVSVASGWHPDDFLFRPENHADAKNVMMRELDVLRRLWRGEKVAFPGPKGKEVTVATLPRPVQKELPVWITTAGNPETFRVAGEAGANLLTHLLGQSLEDLAMKLGVYRAAWKAKGHPGEGHVTLMLHTFVGTDEEEVREIVRKPMTDYLRSAASLIRAQASSFPAFKKRVEAGGEADQVFRNLSDADLEGLLAHAFERYYETSGLFGTAASCVAFVDKVKGLGVDEVACLIDFGVPTEQALRGLQQLNELRKLTSGAPGENEDHSISAEIKRHRVTHLQCTPSMAGMLAMDPDSRRALGQVRNLLVGGEALPASLADELKGIVPGCVTNMYGPTETTVWSSTHALSGSEDPVPIGRPIANTQLYVLDRDGELVPPGLPGELFIGGDGVARGYLDRIELTAERFVPDRFGRAGGRLYRTGDLVRQRPDGRVEFLGRLDHQVKVRGYRVELGEIEELLRQHSAVREAVVVAREDAPGDRRIVAYFVLRSPVDPRELREHLKERLPEFMVPSHMVALDALPLTPNAKVDRKQLPAPESVARTEEPTFTAPEGELESTIAGIWQDVLSVPRVGVDDNFFDRGGHSLLVVQVLAKLREATGKNLPITDMFRFPTVRSLSRYLSAGEGEAPSLAGVEERGSSRRELLRLRQTRARLQ